MKKFFCLMDKLPQSLGAAIILLKIYQGVATILLKIYQGVPSIKTANKAVSKEKVLTLLNIFKSNLLHIRF